MSVPLDDPTGSALLFSVSLAGDEARKQNKELYPHVLAR